MAENRDQLRFVIGSQPRALVLSQLANGPTTPSRIAAAEDIEFASVSHALTDLCDRGLVELLVPEERNKGRIYGLTETGEDIFHQINKEETLNE